MTISSPCVVFRPSTSTSRLEPPRLDEEVFPLGVRAPPFAVPQAWVVRVKRFQLSLSLLLSLGPSSAFMPRFDIGYLRRALIGVLPLPDFIWLPSKHSVLLNQFRKLE